MEILLPQKNPFKFSCEKCHYYTCNLKDFKRHTATQKHNGTLMEIKKPHLPPFVCEICNKKYLNYSGLWKHKQKCINHMQIQDNDNFKLLSNMVLEVISQNKELITQNFEVVKINQDMQQQMIEISKERSNITNNNSNNNSNNKTFNLNMFLNEQCKDAMNLTDFVDSLQFQLSDLEKIGELGYVAGLSNIIIRNLKALDVFKRPVHCSDAKRETIFIKEADKWEKENEDNEKLNKAIKIIANKNIRMIPKWREKYPECAHSDSCKSDQYNNIIIQSLDTNPNSNHKIISNIAKEIKIDKLSIQ